MEDSEPMFRTEPSSSAMRARPLTCVFTRSCQLTTDLVEAVMVFEPRAMLTAGITRATSPARLPMACGTASISAGNTMHTQSNIARARAWGDFVFMGPFLQPNVTYRCYGRVSEVSIEKARR